MKTVKVAVIGIGNMGSAHASCIAKNEINGMSLTAVCDISHKKLETFSQKYPHIKCYESYEKLFEDKVCDSVIIAVPHPLHAEIAICAFKHGLNVMLEKPADISVSRVKKLNEAAEKSGKIFGIMFNQRTNPLFAKAREIVKSGELGELKRTIWIITNWFRTQSYYDSGDWRATWSGEGGGVLLNQAPHNLDLWQWICGMPDSVTAFCDVAKYHNIEVEDDATIFTRYKNGATGVFMTSTGEYPGTNRLEISGDLGKIVLENGVLKRYKLKEPISEVIVKSKEGFAQIDYDYAEIKQEKPETSHRGILQNFANVVLFGEELISPGYDGINELTLSNAAYLSQWQGNREITLPFDSNLFDNLLAEKAKQSKRRATDSEKSGNISYLPRWQVRW
ncbi:MAG: Gfo/Idh/MocA family oxidoreductase [Acutalibacteraceae bacterium]|nr:Gfo/Idh/MocA family oxidoreductase [Acutalibacteraceae bacterium]